MQPSMFQEDEHGARLMDRRREGVQEATPGGKPRPGPPASPSPGTVTESGVP